ncbi:16S rRNA (uracil(1498)-N(3))-methyltransferase [Pseudoduganella albidiflava]|uniref:Ribosomal RNA small subunit methyltransferase E n=1 Tax=Pseudoduganella albidiflava TaxID=321983 RepID=A0A411X2U7_9BURK|nr:16S rRNA (uracil(1498)-N(3))-methyltransferase [Pseudoduganella albidiflava]QBI03356.1 16S rRNA (uracil(1498)-N(3))-methyltransferase [Pseudoduganella albidiflava]GGY66784.1 ribosomal RNA small subunit methyltransferase E [Pseudoduganella albidiflava]
MPRFYIDAPLATGQLLDLPAEVAHHIHVVRLAPGDALTLFNGTGGQYEAELVEVGKKRATAEIKAFDGREAELPYPVTLAQALPEGTKMDWIIEKAVELGVTAVQPLAARRCVVRLSAERAQKKLEHWQGVIVAAAEQSGRNRLAALDGPMDLKEWLARPADGQRILLSPRATGSLAAWSRAQAPQPVTLLVGPEGGFTDEEEALARQFGALALSAGPRVLRTETAALAVLAVLSAAWGGM